MSRKKQSRPIAGYSDEELRPKGLTHLLLGTVALFAVVFVSWAAWAHLEEVTRGQGRVIPSKQTQVVQNLEGGIVAEIMVREGQVVEAGEVLMRIDNVRAASDYREQQARYLAVLAGIARLEAELGGEGEIEFPQEVLDQAPELADGERALHASREREREGELEILRSQAEQRAQEAAEIENRQGQLQRSYRLAAEELAVTEPLAKRRIVAQTDLLQLQREVNDLRGEMQQTELALPRVKTALREAEQRVAAAETTFRTEALREINRLRSELRGLREVIKAGEDSFRRTEVRSPERGTVKKLHIYTIGGVIGPGDPLVEIVPLEDTLLVEARVRPSDIAFLRPDLPATVKITAYDFAIYGGLRGEVENISADTITDERGESFYRIRVRTEDNHLGPPEDPLEIIPGMTAEVDIITGEKSVLDYLLKPILRARDHALRER